MMMMITMMMMMMMVMVMVMTMMMMVILPEVWEHVLDYYNQKSDTWNTETGSRT